MVIRDDDPRWTDHIVRVIGTVPVNMRRDPAKTATRVTTLAPSIDHAVRSIRRGKLTAEEAGYSFDSENFIWYPIDYRGFIGWVREDVVDMTEIVKPEVPLDELSREALIQLITQTRGELQNSYTAQMQTLEMMKVLNGLIEETITSIEAGHQNMGAFLNAAEALLKEG